MNLVFDFGAVLFTWKPAALMRQTFAERVLTDEAARQLAHQVFAHPDWHDFDRGVLSARQVSARTAQRLDLPLTAMQALVDGIGEQLSVMEDSLAVLQRLHARRQAGGGVAGLYYLSNMPQPYARVLERRHAFLKWFDGGIFSADVQLIKPEPAIYRLLQERYALPAGRTLFIDDLPANVRAAQALGWYGIHFTSAQALQAALASWGV